MRMAEASHKRQNDAAAAQAKVQAELQAYGMKSDIDIQKAAKLSQIKLMEAKALQDIEMPKEQMEFQEEVYLTKLRATTDWGAMKYGEDRKDDRTALQASQQSKLKKASADRWAADRF